MPDSLILIDMFVRGVGAGAFLALGVAAVTSRLPRPTRFVGLAFAVSAAAWILTESDKLWAAFGYSTVLMFLACPVAGFFWLFARVVFEDQPVAPLQLAPAALLWAAGMATGPAPAPLETWLWAGRNVFGGLLCLHILAMIAAGWRGDLLEARRRLRGPLLGVAALFSVAMVIAAVGNRLHPLGALRYLDVGGPYGGTVVAMFAVLGGMVFLQARGEVFGADRKASGAASADVRAEAAERFMAGRLNDLMAAGAWRREGLTIGALAQELGEPEHRLRRLINQRLGHRNFADFVNGYRIEAAKARLADAAEARTTVAVIAFDLGYGSLGPFNRAFRAATGVTPTEWRRQALAAEPTLQEAGAAG